MQSLQEQYMHRPRGQRRRWFFYGILLIALALSLSGISVKLATTRAATATGRNATNLVQLSNDPYTNTAPGGVYHQTGYEPASYAFGSTIVTTFQLGRFDGGGSTNLGWATSTDAGKHWQTGLLSGTTTYAGGSHGAISNASVAYDPAHRVWLLGYLFVDGTTINGQLTHYQTIAVSRSLDGGLTWSAPVIVSTPPSGDQSYDQPWMSCDTSVHSPFFGHCYMLWNDDPEIDLSTSTDGGATWGAIKHSAHPFNGVSGKLVVQPNGTVVVVTPDDSDNPFVENLVAFTSTDGGQSWGSIINVSTLAGFYPSLTEDAQGTLYVVAPGIAGGSINSSAAYLAHSTDGIHWTVPQTIIAPGGASISYDHVALAADSQTAGEETHLGLTYYVTDYSASPPTLQAFFISSPDAGLHWSTAKALSPLMSYNWVLPRRTVGDYISMVFRYGRAFPFVVIGRERGNTDPYHQEVYTIEGGIRC